jgi:hypothetical protein
MDKELLFGCMFFTRTLQCACQSAVQVKDLGLAPSRARCPKNAMLERYLRDGHRFSSNSHCAGYLLSSVSTGVPAATYQSGTMARSNWTTYNLGVSVIPLFPAETTEVLEWRLL